MENFHILLRKVENSGDCIYMGKLVIDGNSVYEIDEECIRKKETQEKLSRSNGKEAEKRKGKK